MESAPDFDARRVAVMINTNFVKGWLEKPQGWMGRAGLPGVGRAFTGWAQPWAASIRPAHGELYSWRRRLARAAESFDPPVLDVYGRGWDGETLSWWTAYARGPFARATQAPTGHREALQARQGKIQVMSAYRFGIGVENYRGCKGYISEKIIDPIRAGAVPVYLGEASITQTVPAAAFVDARQFASQRALLAYLRDCPRAQWEGMRAAGREWLASPAAEAFSGARFARTALDVLHGLFPARVRQVHGSGLERAA